MKRKSARLIKGFVFIVFTALTLGLGSCEKSQSYSELLRQEEKAVNRFLAGQRVENKIPEDSISFETGKDAPFYRLDTDGYLYMQVINKGDLSQKVKPGDLVYFRFNREDLKAKYLGQDTGTIGNQNGFQNSADYSFSFVFKNNYLASTEAWGLGVQWPLKFLGYNSEVNLVLQSYYGFSDDQTQCIPYLINIKYYRPEY